MGRAARWLRGLLGGKKSTEEDKQQHSSSSSKEKRRWGFGKSFRVKDKDKRGPPPPPSHYYSSSSTAAAAREDEDEQHNRRAIAMAAATAAVAEAAVAAAQAAAAVVRLTSNSGGGGGSSSSSRKREEWAAAVKIQAAFRAYLARRALRALRGLVKLQALVRGNIVRKQAAETLRCMQALVRVQARTRACRALRADRNHRSKAPRLHPGPSTPDKYEQAIRSKAMNSHHKRSSSHASGTTRGQDQEQAKYSGWNWLDRWMEERYWDGRELNKSGVAAMNAPLDDEKNAKILEIDTGKPNVRRKSSYHHSCSTAASDQNSRSFNTMPDSPSKDSTVVQRSIPSPSSVDMQSISPLRFPVVDGGNYFDSPHFFSASSRPGSSRREPFTPSKSECSRSFLSAYSDYPNYMANTESSRAKVRSQSAPKQRPDFEKSGSVRKVSGHGFPQPSAGPIQKSSSLHSKFANKAYPGSGRLDRLGMPIKI